MQALYQLEMNPGLGAAGVVREFARHRLGREIDGDVYGEADGALFEKIVAGVADDRERLDQTLAAALTEEWPLARLETILRVLLEAAAYELVHRADIPPRVILSEYVQIADAFFAGKEPALANGVLHRLAASFRGDEL